MEGLLEIIARWVILKRKELGSWGDIIVAGLVIAIVVGIVTTIFVLWS